MKYLLIILTFGLLACSEESWTEKQQKDFVDECMGEGGGKVYCKCYMETTMNEYPHYQDLERMTFEEAVELSQKCKN